MGFDAEKLYENLLRNSTFGYIILHEDLSTFVLLPLVRNILYFEKSSNTEHFYIVDSYCRLTATKRGCIVACPWQ
jgi:hypothetical protein